MKKNHKMLPEKIYLHLSVGDSLRIARELQELTQGDLADLTGLTQATISSIENNRVALGVDRAKKLAIALKVHPAVLLFPDWKTESHSA